MTSYSGYVDIHSHILANIDDGPASIEESLGLAREALANGVSDIIATPHLKPDFFPFSMHAVRKAFERLNKALERENVDINLHLGAEVSISGRLMEQFKAGDVPTLADSHYLLLELPFDLIPPFANQVVFQLRLAGIIPVLAHPERSADIQRDPVLIKPFIEAGCLAQINSTSLTGRLGSRARTTAIALLTNGWAHVMASDSHLAGDRGPNFIEAVALAAKYVGAEEATRLVAGNPRRILTYCS